MTGVPPGWERTTIGEVAEISLGKMLDRKQATGLHPTPYLRNINVRWGTFDLSDLAAMDIRPEELERVLARPGDVVACEGGEPGRAAVWKGPGTIALQKALHRIRPADAIVPGYLALLLQNLTVSRSLEQFFTGTTIKHLPQEKLRLVPVPLPPAAEQERIVDAVEEHLSRLDAADAVLLAATKRLNALEARSVDAAFSCFRSQVPVGDLAEVRGGIQKQPKRAPKDNPAPFLRVANVGQGTMDLGDVHEVELFDGELERYRLEAGDLLVVEGNGSPDQIGRAAVWHGEIEGCVHQNHLIRVRPGPELDPEFLGLYWNAPSARTQLTAVASSTSGLYTLSTSKVKRVEVPVVELDEQSATVERLSAQTAAFGRLRASLKMASARQTSLRRSILVAAFSGQLVAQDPDDEPASALLESIRTDRAAATSSKRTRKAKAS
jgi:type I restriction enzyme S subunit